VAPNAGVSAVESLGQEVASAEGAPVLQVAAGLAGGGVQAVTAGPLLRVLHVLHHGALCEGLLMALVMGVWQMRGLGRHQGGGAGPRDGRLLPAWAVLRLGSDVTKLVLDPDLNGLKV